MRVNLIIAMAMLLATPAYADVPSRACSSSKNPEDTIAACTTDLKQKASPENQAAAFTARAKAYDALGMTSEARADYDQAVTLAPGFIPWFNRGQFFLDSGLFAPAASDFSSAIALYDSTKGRGIPDAQYTEAHLQRGHALRRGERYAEAVGDYSWVIDQDFRNLAAYTQRAFCYSHLGKLDEDIADLSRAMSLNGIDAVSLYNRAQAYVRKGDPALALTDLSDAIKRSPGWAMPLVARGGLLEQMGQPGKALADYHLAARLDPTLASAKAALARLEP